MLGREGDPVHDDIELSSADRLPDRVWLSRVAVQQADLVWERSLRGAGPAIEHGQLYALLNREPGACRADHTAAPDEQGFQTGHMHTLKGAARPSSGQAMTVSNRRPPSTGDFWPQTGRRTPQTHAWAAGRARSLDSGDDRTWSLDECLRSHRPTTSARRSLWPSRTALFSTLLPIPMRRQRERTIRSSRACIRRV